MKKLLFGLMIFVSTNAFAGTVSITPFISGNDVTIAHLEELRTEISDTLNGGIEGGVNIQIGSLVSQDFSNSVSPVTRWAESFTDFTYEGMLPPTSADLTSTITAGISYVDGYRVVIGSTAHTFSASKDTYVYVNSGGFYLFEEVANGAAQPSTPNNSLLLAKVITSGSAITTVDDLRTTGIGFGTSTSIVPSNYRDEMVVSRDSTTTITVMPGILEINGSKIQKTSQTTLTISTAGDWAGGSSLRAASTFGFVGCDTSGNLKMHTTAPTHSDYAVTVTAGKKRYATWSGTVYRIIGWFYMDGAQLLDVVSNIKEMGVKNTIISNDAASVSLSSSTLIEVAKIQFYNSGGNILIGQIVSGDTAGGNDVLAIELRRGASGTIQGAGAAEGAGAGQGLTVSPSYLDINQPQGTTSYSVMARNTGTVTMRRRALIINEQ